MQFSKNISMYTQDKSITFPIAYKSWNTLIGVGFVIAGAGRQIVDVKLTGFVTTSDYRTGATNSYLALGI